MNGSRTLAPLLAASLLFFTFAGPASAVLVDNGTTTVDTDTNLEWLDLTATLGLSLADAQLTTFVTVDGYRLATSLEVATLFGNAGVGTLDNLAREVDYAGATSLLNLVGCTVAPALCASANPIGTGFAEWTPGTGRRALYRTDIINGGRGAASVQSSFVTGADPAIGTFLVRGVVPEPSTSLLLMGGLAWLGSAHRRQASRR